MKQLNHYVIMDDLDEYVFSNSDLDDCEEDVDNGYYNASCSGIKMSFETDFSDEEVVGCFEYQVIDKENLIFQKELRRILEGRIILWRLQSVKIQHNFMWLTFFNQNLYNQKWHNQQEETSYYQENVCFSWKAKNEDYVKFHFELKHTTKYTESVSVLFRSGEQTEIKERNSLGSRYIYLPGFKLVGDDALRIVRVVDNYR